MVQWHYEITGYENSDWKETHLFLQLCIDGIWNDLLLECSSSQFPSPVAYSQIFTLSLDLYSTSGKPKTDKH